MATAQRIATDVAELDGQQEDEQPLQPLENGEPRRWSERANAVTSCILVGLTFVPWELKKDMTWYLVAQSLVLFCIIASVACLFVGNTHTRMLRFLVNKICFKKVALLALADWLRDMVMPAPGWEVTDRIVGTSLFVARIAFFCLDSLRGQSRWYRIFMASMFMLGNINGIFSAHFLSSAQTIFTFEATNTTITTSGIKASVATTTVTLTASMLVTIWHDTHFQYSALYRSHLPKMAVEAAGIEPGSDEMQEILSQFKKDVVAWRGWPRKPAVMILVSVAVFVSSIALKTTPLARDDDGKESAVYIAMRVISLALGAVGASALMMGKISWRRWRHTFTSTEGCLWVFYSLIFAAAGLARPRKDEVVADALSMAYVLLGMLCWLSFESVKQISRTMHITITFAIAITLAGVIYLSAYVWQDDAVLADLNGRERAGVMTRYSLQRTCAINLLVVMAVSIKNVVKKNLSDNSYFALVAGAVTRRQILEVVRMSDNPDGDHDMVVENSLDHQLRRHSSLTLMDDP